MTVKIAFATFVSLVYVPAVWAAGGQDLELIPMSLKVLASLAIVLGLVLFLYAVMKRGNLIPGAKGGEIRIIEIRHLAPKKTLYLVEVKDKTLLIGATAERLDALAQWPSQSAEPFADVLSATERQTSGEGV